MIKLDAQALRKGDHSNLDFKSLKRHEIYIILDNILDTYNIGSIFRLADAVAAKKIYLTAGSETPPNHRIKKSSVNTTEVVPWVYFEKTGDAIADLRASVKNIKVVAVEQAENSIAYDKCDYDMPLALVVGHESSGISEEILNLCDAVVELPMYGVNISLNVMVSLGIVLYETLRVLYSNDSNKKTASKT